MLAKLTQSRRIYYKSLASLLVILSLLTLASCQASLQKSEKETNSEQWHAGFAQMLTSQWEEVEQINKPVARHEASLVAHDNILYLLGGRRVNPTNVFNPITATWKLGAKPPIEVHHFQAVSFDDGIYILGAFTGGWPNEIPIDRVIKYTPSTDSFTFTHTIPESRRRGGAASVVYQNKIYVIGGITEGHMRGTNAWFDAYDPRTGKWTRLADAPNARDHLQAAVYDHKLYLLGGRRSSQATKQGFELTTPYVDVYDFRTDQWSSLPESLNIPVQSAGNMAIATDYGLVAGGGESGSQRAAHDEVFLFSPEKQSWTQLGNLNRGRHGTGFAMVFVDGNDYIYTVSGSGNRGGGPELVSAERFKLP
ncbi:Kelch repeat-containing protein [Agaribacter flavus]|uniref:Kelch repeat-containing protein n=1 Tax=Agaribacter flavus TaxID=1902781 RepID=A0ABV7FVV0_9ALTE